ncbi:MAG: type II toxin-antitoxin system CcdA family antitoxin [Candidatus Bathyarchaeia archaeon]
MKVRTNILIKESVLREAQELGINVSKACENYLKILIQTIKTTNAQIQQQNQTLPTKKEGIGNVVSDKDCWRARRELNPGPTG